MTTPTNIQGTPKPKASEPFKEEPKATPEAPETPFDFAAYLATLSPEEQQRVVTDGMRTLTADVRKVVTTEARVSTEDAEAKVARAKEADGFAKDDAAIVGKTHDDLIKDDFRPSTRQEMVFVIRYIFTPGNKVKEEGAWLPFAKAKGSGATGEHRQVLQERIIFPMALKDEKGQSWGEGQPKEHGIPALCAKLGIVVNGDSAPRKLAKAMLAKAKGYGLTYDGKDALLRAKDAKAKGMLGARK
jgi:hypothetical protein